MQLLILTALLIIAALLSMLASCTAPIGENTSSVGGGSAVGSNGTEATDRSASDQTSSKESSNTGTDVQSPSSGGDATETTPEESVLPDHSSTTRTPEEEPLIPTENADAYLTLYSDYEAAENWLRKNVLESDLPPVSFALGKKRSSEMVWTKRVGEPETVVDYPDSDALAQRTVRTVEYTDEGGELKIDLTLTVYPGYPIVEYDARLTNLTDHVTEVLSELSSLDCALDASGEYLLRYNRGSGGYSANDYEPLSRKITPTGVKIKATDGMPTSAYLPYFNAENGEGGGVILAVNWQGNWFSSFKRSEDKLYLSAGQEGFGSVMLENESFKLPGTVLLFYKNADWQYGQNVWRRFIVSHNLMRYTGRRDFRQNVFVCSDFSGPKKDLANIANIAARGLAKTYNCVYEFDAGWYTGSNVDWFTSVGNWTPKPAYAGGALKRVSDACREAGISFCMWLEPERLYSNSAAGAALGENAIYLDAGGNYAGYSPQLAAGSTMGLINYGKKEAQDYVVDLISSVVREYGVDVYRQDFNTENGKFWIAYDRYERSLYGARRSGATENHACEGYIRAWTRIAEENPGLVFDACAGGGRRYDLETLRFGFMHTKSDYWSDVVSQQGQNLGVYSWDIFTGTGFADPSDLYDVRSRLTLSIGIGAAGADGTTDSSLAEWSSLQKYMYGDFYQLTGYSLNGSANSAVQFCDTEKGEGMIAAYLRAGGVFDVCAKALEPGSRYRVISKDDPENPRVLTGWTFMNEGYLLVSGGNGPKAFILFYEKTDGEVTPFDREAELKKYEIIDYASLKAQVNDEEKIVSAARGREIGSNGLLYICPDSNCSGGIYLIGETVYTELLSKSTGTNSEGWTTLSGNGVSIVLPNNWGTYTVASWGPGKPFDVRAYVKELDGMRFLWLDNSFSFGDPDGGWTVDVRWIKVGGYTSDAFTFVVSPTSQIGERDVQFVDVDADKTGAVYICGDNVFSLLPRSENKKTAMGVEWTQLDQRKFYLQCANNSNVHNEDDPSAYTVLMGERIEQKYGVRFWVGENENGSFLWIENSRAAGTKISSDRCELYFVCGDTLRHTQFYLVTAYAREGVTVPPPTLVDF